MNRVGIAVFLAAAGGLLTPASAQEFRSYLQADLARNRSACSVGTPTPRDLPSVIEVSGKYTGAVVGLDKITWDWAQAFMRLGSTSRVDEAAALRAREELLEIARANPMQWARGTSADRGKEAEAVFLSLRVGLLLALEFHFQKAALSQSEADEIEKYIGSLLKRIRNSDSITRVEINNKTMMLAAASYALGLAADDRSAKQSAIRLFRQALREMRDDGRMPADARRAGSAVHYTNLAISNMVLVAELAAVDGENLYDLTVSGKSLHTGISYLLAVTQNPALIAPHATDTGTGKEGYSATRQDLRWATGGMAGWGHYYAARYPEHANTKTLKSLSPQVAKRGSGLFEFAGGNALCHTAVVQ
jgi:poly(beta-D-mannuronate) lyase